MQINLIGYLGTFYTPEKLQICSHHQIDGSNTQSVAESYPATSGIQLFPVIHSHAGQWLVQSGPASKGTSEKVGPPPRSPIPRLRHLKRMHLFGAGLCLPGRSPCLLSAFVGLWNATTFLSYRKVVAQTRRCRRSSTSSGMVCGKNIPWLGRCTPLPKQTFRSVLAINCSSLSCNLWLPLLCVY